MRGGWPRPDPGRAGAKTLTLTVALAAASIAALWRWWPSGGSVDGTPLRWWTIAAIAMLADVLVFHLEFRRETYTFTFAEVLLVLGMFLAAPGALIAGRLLGEFVVLTVKERQPARKVSLNLAMFTAECTVLVLLHHVVNDGLSIVAPRAWLGALAVAVTAEMVGFLTVGLVIRWHGSTVDLRAIVFAGLLTAPVNTSLGLTAGILITTQPWATLLLGGVAAFLFVAYRSYSTLARRHESLSLLYDFTRLMSRSKRPDTVLEAILTQAKDLLHAERAEIWIADGGDRFVTLQVDDDGQHTPPDRPSLGSSLIDRFGRDPAALVVTKREGQGPGRAIAELLDGQDCMIAPIREGVGIAGFIAVVDRIGEMTSFGPTDQRMFETLASHASIALENGRLIERLHDEARQREHEALHDALTGLPNRVLFHRELLAGLAAAAVDRPIAVAVMDLDGFKEINDTLGHQAGDLVLVEVGRRLSHAADRSTTVARLGGDEFALLFTPGVTTDQLTADAIRVREAISAPMPMQGLMLSVGVSIGLTTSSHPGADAETLLQRADVAMYAAKADGGGHRFYDEEADDNTPRRLALTNDLRPAIDEGQLFCLYQPKAALADGRITGVEGLVRWRHPSFGLVLPDEFVPLAERSEVITALTEFVLRATLEQCRQWAAAGLVLDISVNLSMRNLLDASFPATVGELLAASAVDAGRLTLEITETNVMSDPARTLHVLDELSALGVRLSIDDFGTGYSSLAYLNKLPADEIKIDKSFVFPMASDPAAESLVRSIIELGHALGLTVVAEGIEDEATWQRLHALGCELAQGYYLARPISAAEITELCHRQALERLERLTVAEAPPLPAFPLPAIHELGGRIVGELSPASSDQARTTYGGSRVHPDDGW